MRRGDYMVAVDADEQHAHQVIDVLEENGAIDLDAEEARWRNEGWHGYRAGSGAMTDSPAATTGTAGAMGGANAATIPPMPGSRDAAGAPFSGAETTTSADVGPSVTTGTVADRSTADTLARRDIDEATTQRDRATAATTTSGTGLAASTPVRDAAGSGEERIPLVEERLRVGKRQVVAGRVRIRSYVVEEPVSETVHLRQEHVDVQRRPVDRPLGASEADPFREREIEATESREEPVVSKDTRVREELVLHKSVEEQDETVRDTVRRTEVREDHEDAGPDPATTARDPGPARQP
jgi:uncharacterized protein (TIGR02271 family)